MTSYKNPFFAKKNQNKTANSGKNIILDKIFEDINILNDDIIFKDESIDNIKEIDDYSGNITTTQLKNIDYSLFSNHVFFDSAVHKVSYSFLDIYNFPYDKSEPEYLEYKGKIDGYTNYILENFYPKYTGSIKFNGQNKVIVKDKKGFYLDDYTETNNMKRHGFLSPKSNPFTFSFHIKTPSLQSLNDNDFQCVFKKVIVNNNNIVSEGFCCYVNKISESKCRLNFLVKFQEGNEKISSVDLDVESLFYINIISKQDSNNNLQINFYLDGEILDTIETTTSNIIYSGFSSLFEDKDIEFIFGGSENIQININNIATALNNFIGELDEFIYFSEDRDTKDIKYFKDQNIFTNNKVLLYLKFNEPGGEYVNSCITLDSSGNKLHGCIVDLANNITEDTTQIKQDVSFLGLESLLLNPVVLGTYPETLTQRNNLISSASEFDASNANIIFNLLPKHYFTNSASYENKIAYIDSTESDDLKNQVNNTLLTNICLIWARYFDQLKLYVDSIADFFELDYDNINDQKFVNSQMMLLCKKYGFDFAEIDPNLTRDQYDNKNLTFDNTYSSLSLTKLQNLMWKKILINSQNFLRSKGTINSIKSVFNSTGLEYDKFINIEEKSNINHVNLTNSFKIKNERIKALNFVNYKDIESTFSDDSIFVQNKPVMQISNVSCLKETNGEYQITSGFSDDASIEVYFGFNELVYNDGISLGDNQYNTLQNIFHINDQNGNCIGTLYAIFKNNSTKFCDLIFDVLLTPTLGPAVAAKRKISLKIEKINAYDVEHYVSISFQNSNNSIKTILKYNTISDVYESLKIKSVENSTTIGDFQNFIFTKNSFNIITGETKYENQNLTITPLNRSITTSDTIFEGHIYNIRLWRKSLSDVECIRHSQDILNISEENVKFNKISHQLVSNFMFNEIPFDSQNVDLSTNSANFCKNYVDYLIVNDEYQESNSLTVKIHDNSTHNNDALFYYETINRKVMSGTIDTVDSNFSNRVKILSFNDMSLNDAYNTHTDTTLYDINKNYNLETTNVINITMSSAKIMNESIERLINKLDNFTKVLSENCQLYENEYFNLEKIRNEYYFNFKEDEHINLHQFSYIFKYYDNILNNILYKLIPHNVDFSGFNLVYESNLLERSKYEYKNRESNIPINDIYDYEVIQDKNSVKGKRSRQYNLNRKHSIN